MASRKTRYGLLLASLTCLVASPALGQATSVIGRSNTAYAPVGMRYGPFMAYPSVSLAYAYDTNIYATRTNPESDSILGAIASLDINSNWSRHSLSLNGRVDSENYLSHGEEDRLDWGGGGALTLDLTRRFVLAFSGDYVGRHESRDDPQSVAQAVSPVAYTEANGGAEFRADFFPINLVLGATYSERSYDDAELVGGGIASQAYRDRDGWAANARIELAVSPDTFLFVQAIESETDYLLDPPVVSIGRDSKFRAVLGGVRFDVTKLMSGQIGAGYFERDNRDLVQSDSSGLAINTSLQWIMTPLMTVGFSASRTTSDSDLPGAPGSIDTSVGASLDYELLRDLILSVRGDYLDIQYTGLDRDDVRWDAQLSANWLVNRHVSFLMTYSHRNQDSSGAFLGQIFDKDVVSATLRLAV